MEGNRDLPEIETPNISIDLRGFFTHSDIIGGAALAKH
jgi:hypothetical protein